jgi:hypothetical protein
MYAPKSANPENIPELYSLQQFTNVVGYVFSAKHSSKDSNLDAPVLSSNSPEADAGSKATVDLRERKSINLT